ncbi:hypothetical protein N665_0150s0010 [Sinapis alba]|nr:hypothetical protein N665_0150s0010 [Sinapis alba]
MDQFSNEEDGSRDKPTDKEDALTIPNGPLTRARTRNLNEAIGSILKISWKLEDNIVQTWSNQVPRLNESEEEAELIRQNKLLREQMAAQNQNMITTMTEMMKASMKDLHDELRHEFRLATGQGHSNESRRDRRTQTPQDQAEVREEARGNRREHAGSQETENYYERSHSSSSKDSRRRHKRDHDGRRHHRDELAGLKLKIPSFHGKADPDAYLEWEKKIEIVFNCQSYTQAQKIQIAATEF